MTKGILEFTFHGHRHTYFRRFNIFGETITTNNPKSAKLIKESQVPIIVKRLQKDYGMEWIKDINFIPQKLNK